MIAFPKHPHSDQGISDEEELDGDGSENCVSLGGPTGEKGVLHIQSQLEMLRGTQKVNHMGKTQTGFSCDGETKMPIFNTEGNFVCFSKKSFTTNSDEEMISDDEGNNVPSKFSNISGCKGLQKANPPSFGSDKRSCSWSEATKEAEALMCLNDSAECCSSHVANFKANTFCKGGKGKAKPKFSFRFQLPKEGFFLSSILKDERDFCCKDQHVPQEAVALWTAEHSMSELLEDFQGERTTYSEINGMPAEVDTSGHGLANNSMTELLDGLQDKTGDNRTKGNRVQLAGKKSILSLGDRNTDDEDPPELMGDGTSSDEETYNQNLKLVIPEIERQTMADRFHEVLSAAQVNDEGLPVAAHKLSGGLYGQLQQVMQNERGREMDFSRKLQAGISPNDEASCIDLKILSKYLDGKVTVCLCSFKENEESPQMRRESGERKRTVIFNPRACTDVDLEVGSLIRIHPPWKEVQIMANDECIILSAYFSQI
ncbi:uncharacterized protein LOC131156308 isoform X3 [Malania oleifera]|uniref:uncharacterized protein LOC131156308 isoform X3 n=1 Tax=Malania oleifera TaxID=397392 RepID=UPI0025ADE512|nr:uncharacterized protein LOC131156308 isoform X3 [Malania oleifera]